MTPPALALDVAPEVAAALAAGHAVVALESTIITHGMPYPDNLATARAVQAAVRAHGAVPATIAVTGGRLRAGLDDAALQALAAEPGAAKASPRDLAPILARGGRAGTTVAATLLIAAMAGIRVFATGGIGGVHRGAEATFDISADLAALAATPVAVVCAGVKSILDIPKTLEVLETAGVPVLGYRTSAFPAFFTRDSGQRLEHRLDSPGALAEVVALHWRLGLRSGLLIANPIPEDAALPHAEMEAGIAAACREAAAAGISGKALTPFLLARINALTEGRSLQANIALIRHNAAVAAELAVALAELHAQQSPAAPNATG
jgi:pseudouridine-5'-phosphate glycosidase